MLINLGCCYRCLTVTTVVTTKNPAPRYNRLRVGPVAVLGRGAVLVLGDFHIDFEYLFERLTVATTYGALTINAV